MLIDCKLQVEQMSTENLIIFRRKIAAEFRKLWISKLIKYVYKMLERSRFFCFIMLNFQVKVFIKSLLLLWQRRAVVNYYLTYLFRTYEMDTDPSEWICKLAFMFYIILKYTIRQTKTHTRYTSTCNGR